jgi:hypothetical protein
MAVYKTPLYIRITPSLHKEIELPKTTRKILVEKKTTS